VNFRSY